jgi:transposase
MRGVTMARKKAKAYPESFRKEAVRLADLPDRTATDVAKELGIHVGQIYNWRAQYSKLAKGQFKKVDGVDYSKDESAELRRLRKENAKLREERDFLKKATAYFAKDDK